MTASHPVGHVRVEVVSTGETGHVNPDQPSDGCRTLHLDSGGTRLLGGAEIIRFLPPDWDLLPPEEVAR